MMATVLKKMERHEDADVFGPTLERNPKHLEAWKNASTCKRWRPTTSLILLDNAFEHLPPTSTTLGHKHL